jgi:anti-sigma-K factor RskA
MSNSDEQFEGELRDALAVQSGGPRQRDIEHLRQLAARQSTSVTTKQHRSRRGGVPTWIAGAVAASLVIGAFVLGSRIGDDTRASSEGIAEFSEKLDLAGGGAVFVAGRRTGIGRIVDIETDDLSILPVGEFYEVWFVAADDVPGAPNRISAGTFHPDNNGRTDISLTAAVDPTKFPILAITAEPADGNPAASANEVTRGRLRVEPG